MEPRKLSVGVPTDVFWVASAQVDETLEVGGRGASMPRDKVERETRITARTRRRATLVGDQWELVSKPAAESSRIASQLSVRGLTSHSVIRCLMMSSSGIFGAGTCR